MVEIKEILMWLMSNIGISMLGFATGWVLGFRDGFKTHSKVCDQISELKNASKE